MSESPLAWQRWQPDDLLGTRSQAADPAPPRDTAPLPLHVEADLQQLALGELRQQAQQDGQRLGYQEGQQQGFSDGQKAGYEAGYQQGLAEALQQQAPHQARLQQLVAEFQHSLDALDSVIPSRLMQLALAAARQVLGQPAVCDGSALLRHIQQLLQQEPLFSGRPQLRVHPDDLPRIEQSLGATLSLHGWRLLADSTLHPGGCKVSAEDGDLDASVATRWHELCRLAAPGERS
ncbi:flagellar assembly protein FliH [Pantoea sp. 1.19]|uniref:flagellar assembly protein FliH n=1 Tax=Pantoea sp. 1.19 TaxID=1925589 RepID=UPI000948A63E|nr:flagellar assembly protein FliH [Pantoea sp. 1.19]